MKKMESMVKHKSADMYVGRPNYVNRHTERQENTHTETHS